MMIFSFLCLWLGGRLSEDDGRRGDRVRGYQPKGGAGLAHQDCQQSWAQGPRDQVQGHECGFAMVTRLKWAIHRFLHKT